MPGLLNTLLGKVVILLDDYHNTQGGSFSDTVLALNPIQYLIFNESSGAVAADSSGNGLDGAFTNVTLGATGIGDGKTAATFNGTTSKCNVYSAGLVSAFDGAAGSIMVYGKVSGSGVWTDTTSRRLLNLFADNSNRIYINKSSTSNIIECVYIAGGTNKTINISTSTTDWFQVILTWSKANDRVRAYINGVKTGIDATGLGTWAGNLANFSYVGARDTNSNVFSGDLAHYALWDRELTATEVDEVFF